MKLYKHKIDPHYGHDFADLYFAGYRFGFTTSKNKPISPLEFVCMQ